MPYDIFATLADRTRRSIFEGLRREELTVGAIAAKSGISQPAASQHLRILREARLVSARAEGARRLYRADPAGLEELRAYLDTMWGEVLESFATYSSPDAREANHNTTD